MIVEVVDKESGAILFKKDKDTITLEALTKTMNEYEKKIKSLEKKISKLEQNIEDLKSIAEFKNE